MVTTPSTSTTGFTITPSSAPLAVATATLLSKGAPCTWNNDDPPKGGATFPTCPTKGFNFHQYYGGTSLWSFMGLNATYATDRLQKTNAVCWNDGFLSPVQKLESCGFDACARDTCCIKMCDYARARTSSGWGCNWKVNSEGKLWYEIWRPGTMWSPLLGVEVSTVMRTTCDPKKNGGPGSGGGTKGKNSGRHLMSGQSSSLDRQLLQSTICPAGATECIDVCPLGATDCVCFDYAYELAGDGTMAITSFSPNTACGSAVQVTQDEAVTLVAQVATLG